MSTPSTNTGPRPTQPVAVSDPKILAAIEAVKADTAAILKAVAVDKPEEKPEAVPRYFARGYFP